MLREKISSRHKSVRVAYTLVLVLALLAAGVNTPALSGFALAASTTDEDLPLSMRHYECTDGTFSDSYAYWIFDTMARRCADDEKRQAFLSVFEETLLDKERACEVFICEDMPRGYNMMGYEVYELWAECYNCYYKGLNGRLRIVSICPPKSICLQAMAHFYFTICCIFTQAKAIA